jgi:hypothetical protein
MIHIILFNNLYKLFNNIYERHHFINRQYNPYALSGCSGHIPVLRIGTPFKFLYLEKIGAVILRELGLIASGRK